VRRPARLIALALAAAALAGAAWGADKPAVGDQRRSYAFDAAGQIMPYRLYVPTSYDGSKPYPLLMVLHGGGGDENSVFDTTDLAKLAQARGVIVVAPLGYNRFGGYGEIYPVMMRREMGAAIEELRARSAQTGAAAQPGAPARPQEPAAADDAMEVAAAMMVDPKTNQLSEQDVMNVLAQTRREYRIDPARIYLIGNSMGGMGAAYLAAKYPDIWAAVAPAGGPLAVWSYPFARLRAHHVAIMFVHGGGDEHSNARWSKALADEARAQGVDARFLLVPGDSHVRAWIEALPQTFDFLLAHAKRQR
jgi:poly(3-hydroxybutyrate) depolymerase